MQSVMMFRCYVYDAAAFCIGILLSDYVHGRLQKCVHVVRCFNDVNIKLHWCADQIPIVDDEMKKAAGDEKEEDIQMTQGIIQKLVTADGTYASQSAFSAMLPVKKDQAR